MKDKEKEVITITGGAGGIGMACAKALSEYRLVITDYNQQAVDETVDALSALQIDAVGFVCDITDEEAVNQLKDFTAKQGHFKGVVHTAGVSGTVRDPEKVFKIDLLGTDLIVDAFFSLAQAGSVIILLSSMMGHTVPPDEAYDETLRQPQGKNAYKQLALFIGGSSDRMYDFAKRGVQLICRDNAMRYGQKGARIVSVSPGIIMTPMAQKAAEEHPERMQKMKEMTPLRRNGQPEDIVDVVKYLLSREARFITGTDILVDGGILTQLMKSNPL